MFKLLVNIGTQLITEIISSIVIGIIGWSQIKKLKINKLLPVFYPGTKKRLEGIISSDESDIDENDIEWLSNTRVLHKLLITAELKEVVLNRNSKKNTKEIKAVIILSYIFSAKKSFESLEIIIKNGDIKWKIRNAAVISLSNILDREHSQDTEKKIKRLLFEESTMKKSTMKKFPVNTIECLKHFHDDDNILLKLMENVIDGSGKISKASISSIEFISSEREKELPRFFYHYAELVILTHKEQKYVNIMIAILQKKDNPPAIKVIEEVLDSGIYSDNGSRKDWPTLEKLTLEI